MKIVYCMEWSVFRKQPHNIISKQEAKEKHMSRGTYVAAIYENENVKNVIEIDEISLTVRFYDDNLENSLLYGFVKKKEKLFLNMVYYYIYLDGKQIGHIFFNFKDSGEMIAEKRDYNSGDIEEKEDIVDVSYNWAEFPEFGHYDRLISESLVLIKRLTSCLVFCFSWLLNIIL